LNILVITVKKSFWNSEESLYFKNRVHATVLFGHSSNLINSVITAVHSFVAIIKYKPKVVLFGSVGRMVPWFLFLKRIGLFRESKFIISNITKKFSKKNNPFVDRVIVYCRSKINKFSPDLQKKMVFIPIASDMVEAEFPKSIETIEEPYIFCGGGSQRDFDSVIESVRDTNINLVIVTFDTKNLRKRLAIPSNCKLLGKMSLKHFLGLMKQSQFVILPLQAGIDSHGHTTLIQAMSLGKAIISTKDASLSDYMDDGIEGIMVTPGNIVQYKNAIHKFVSNISAREACEKRALLKSKEFTNEIHVHYIKNLCNELIESQGEHVTA
jgi:glycosyltransferase involved in cell wall biosynthesis